MNREKKSIAPPRLLLGIAFLYWGAVVEHPLIGLGCAFLVEARWWMDLRWHFGEAGFPRAWKLSLFFMVLSGLWLWLQGESVLGVFDLMMWLPVLYLPVLLAQQYSVEEKMPLNTFSYVAKRKMELDRAAGREVKPLLVHVGYAYFCLILIGACLGRPSLEVSFVAAGVLGAVGLFFASPLGRMRPVSWSLAVVTAVGLAMGGVAGINGLWRLLHGGNLGLATGQSVGDEAHTAIGTIGEIKQSHRIRWRISMESVGSVRLFKTAGFNRYGNGVWKHRPPPQMMMREKDYKEMTTTGGEEDEEGKVEVERFAFVPEDLQEGRRWERSYRVRGAVHPKRPTPLPLAEGARVLKGVEADIVSYNPLGTVRVENADRGVVDFAVDGGTVNLAENESLPRDNLDLYVPVEEGPGLERVCAKLGMEGLSDREKVAALAEFFGNFLYTMDLQMTVGGEGSGEAITEFLEVTKSGHCEYYGTAATLLLRQAGVPARYCEGFGAQEWDAERKEWVLRGIHAHAWCRAYLGGHPEEQTGAEGMVETVWVGGEWVDVDLTPPGWLGLEQMGAGPPILAQLLDWWQRLREDFLIWRTRPEHRVIVTGIMMAIGVGLLVYIARRMWRHRTRRGREKKRLRPGGEGELVTPLHGLERSAVAVLGPRPEGMALTRWLMGLEGRMSGGPGALRQAVALHWKARFDPLGAEESEREALEVVCQELKREIKGARKG